MARRNGLDICHDILKVAEAGTRKTRIVYGANLNFNIVKKYLKALLEAGHIEYNEDTRLYFTTDKGSYWMMNYNNIVATLKGVLSQPETPQM